MRKLKQIGEEWRTNTRASKRVVAYFVLFFVCALILFGLYNWNECDTYDKLTITIIVLFVAATLFSIFSTRKRDKIDVPKKDEWRQNEIEYNVSLTETWKMINLIFMPVQLFLNGMSIYCSVVTVFITTCDASNTRGIVFYSILSIIFAVLDLILAPNRIGYGYRLAYERSSNELRSYFSGQIPWEKALSAVKEGEQIITKALYDK